jgi:hypothetical protein
MSDVLYARGSLEFNRGTVRTEYLAYVLGRAGNASILDFQRGSAKVYNLNPVSLFARGALNVGGAGSAYISADPVGAFDAFAIYPEGASDPINGFVVANNAGTPTAGVGNSWSRHYAVVLPPKGARFAVPHNRIAAVPAGTSQYFDAHQLEVLRTDLSAPTDFHSARGLQVVVRPARLNYATGGTHVTMLVPGLVYTASADVAGERRSMTFTATSRTTDLDFGGPASRILVEEGTVLGNYFDGGSGPDYLWEQGGTPGATRSYYYPDREMRHYVLVRTLRENVPMGMLVEDPVYAVLPAPSTTG